MYNILYTDPDLLRLNASPKLHGFRFIFFSLTLKNDFQFLKLITQMNIHIYSIKNKTYSVLYISIFNGMESRSRSMSIFLQEFLLCSIH